MAKSNQTRKVASLDNYTTFEETVTSVSRTNLNVLLKRMENEKKMEKKTNLLIFSGTLAIAAVVVVILSL